jgi:hypothetical protein
MAISACGSEKNGGDSVSAAPSSSSSVASPSATVAPSSVTFSSSYYVAPAGDDSSDGSIDKPFKTIAKALQLLQPGQRIYLRAGIYSLTSKITLSGTGSSAGYYGIWGYPGENCILDFSGAPSSYGVYITGSFWYVKNLEVRHAPSSGIRITGNSNIIERCSIHDNGDAGLYIGINKGTAVNTDGSLAAWNQVVNCDSWLNYDPYGSTGDGGNADGFACKLNAGKGNVFRGCRSWENSDDGWDLYLTNFPVTMENCWTWRNGDPSSFNRPDAAAAWSGNGNGFKVGGGSAAKSNEYVSHARHVLRNCIAFDTKYGNSSSERAFDRNNNMSGVLMYNCLAFDSTVGFSFGTQPDDGTHHTLVNCVAYNCATNISLSSDAIQTCNSWNIPGLTISSSDFTSLLVSYAKAARSSDGSLPGGFANLAKGSVLIDKGTTYDGMLNAVIGTGPDLGPFECY